MDTVVSEVPQGCILSPLLFILYTSEMFDLLRNRVFVYAEYSTLLAFLGKPAERSVLASFLNRDSVGIHNWCNR